MNIHLTSTASELDIAIGRYSANINQDAGFYWWKRYTYSAFWSISATPINLLITIITALTTAQSTTGALLGNSISSSLGVTALLLSVVNTFFKPYTQLTDNQALKEKWSDIGIEFETMYYLPAHNDEEKRNKLVKLEDHWDKVCALKKTDDNNYLIDIIFLISKTLCIRKDIKWLPDASEAYKKELFARSQAVRTPSNGIATIQESTI